MATPIPGPANRTTFFEEQARNRRHSLRFAIFAAVSVALMGIPLSILVTPVLFIIVLATAHLIQLATPLAPSFWAVVDQVGNLLPTVFRQVTAAIETRSITSIDWPTLGAFAAVLVVPGMVVMLALWIGVRLLFSRAGSSGVLIRIGARSPNETDLEERQLVNLIAEMAIAGGVKPPKVVLLDIDAVNAAALGTDPDDATLVVTRGLLQRLDRDETQGILAHLVGSVGNGDLKILNLMFSVFQTFGLLGVVIRSVGSKGARRKLWRTIGTIFRPGDQAEIERVAELLAANQGDDEPSGKGGCLTALLVPIAFAGMTVQMLSSIGAWLFFGPPLTAMWRTRRYLADATGLQLTRNPDGLCHALQRFTESEVEFAAGKPSRILFVHWPSYSGGSSDLAQSGRLHPDLWRRIHRLERSGARRLVRESTGEQRPRRSILVRSLLGLFWLLFSIIYLAAIVVTVGMGAFLAALSLAFMGVALFLIQGFFGHLPEIIQFVRVDLPRIGRALWGLVLELARRIG